MRGSLNRPGWESTRGESSRNAKLTEKIVREIKLSDASSYQLAEKYGVHATTIQKIRKGRAWAHVKVEASEK